MNAIERAKAEGRAALNIEECGPLFGVGRAAIFEMARRGILPTIRVSARRAVVPIAALEAMLAAEPPTKVR